mgnify:CR=1 FL=1
MDAVVMKTAEEIFDGLVDRHCLSVINERPMPGWRGLVAGIRLPTEWVAKQRLILDVGNDARSLPGAIYRCIASRLDPEPANSTLCPKAHPGPRLVIAVLPGEVLLPATESQDLYNEMIAALDAPSVGGPAGDLAARWRGRRWH